MADVDVSKRGFLSRTMRLLGVVAVLQASWIAISALAPGRREKPRTDGPGVRTAGPIERFEPGTVTAIPDGGFFIVRLEDGGFLALHRKCTHLGCSVPWDAEQNRFACPCHASAFDMRGDVISAPAPRPLDLFPVAIENGVVKVDTGQLIRRTSFEPDQVVRA
jgi:cytochrome b6-f complex iron-sulfur subunit